MTNLSLRNWFLPWLFSFIAVGIIIGYMFWATDLGDTLSWLELVGYSVGVGLVLGLVGYFLQKARDRISKK